MEQVDIIPAIISVSLFLLVFIREIMLFIPGIRPIILYVQYNIFIIIICRILYQLYFQHVDSHCA